MTAQNYVSDELTHFVGKRLPADSDRLQLLIRILDQSWLQASYRELLGVGIVGRSDSSKLLSSNEAVITPTLCFCDIPEQELGIHVAKYGNFGISFPKPLLLRKGASPVFYVAADASTSNLDPGIGPRTLGERFNQLHTEFLGLCADLDAYVWAREPSGPGTAGLRVTFKHAPAGTPEGQQVLGRLNALSSDFDMLVFSYLKFFNASLAHDDSDNYYMEREWRIRGGLAFRPDDVAHIYILPAFRAELLARHPEYESKLRVIESSR